MSAAAIRSIAPTKRALARTRFPHVTKRASAQLARTFTSTSWQANPSPPSAQTSTDHEHSTSSNTHPDAATLLLLNTIPSIPQYGFTKAAYLSSSSSSSSSSPSSPADRLKAERILQTLFPGPDSSFDARLFTAWNDVYDLASLHALSPEAVLQSLKSGQRVGGMETKQVRTQSRLSKDAERTALGKVTSIIETRLRHSYTVRRHLTHGMTQLSTLSPTTSRLHSIFPHATVLPNLPTPLPLLTMASRFVNGVLTHAATGWVDEDGPEWYAVRARLGVGYVAAMLHVASGGVESFQDTQRLLERVVKGRESGVMATVGEVVGGVREWMGWGGRGWLGVFRSLGL
ncbi:uncharacterized protein SPSC_06006 [Sporisorium scitamineum]|uniref:COQ9 domain-containing protein n=1 Tax=Sporisorium scitamineum TaxID=49012 RepID=A0A127ZIE2_9BASI|nr:uncharacterized protein SPSC_06006 [Sporisorium scitamineum]